MKKRTCCTQRERATGTSVTIATPLDRGHSVMDETLQKCLAVYALAGAERNASILGMNRMITHMEFYGVYDFVIGNWRVRQQLNGSGAVYSNGAWSYYNNKDFNEPDLATAATFTIERLP